MEVGGIYESSASYKLSRYEKFIESFQANFSILCSFQYALYIRPLGICQNCRTERWECGGCRNGWKVVGAANVGQAFTKDVYFWGRPSCAGDGYDASSSAGSNKGATHPEYLQEVESRIDTFLVKHPYLQRSDIPAEMVTASGSGLDPEISKAGAYVQIKRVAQARGMSEEKVKEVVDQYVKGPLFGLFGPASRVNVLKLNVALDEIQKENQK